MEIEQIANTLKELTKEIEKLKNQPEKVEETTVEQEQKIKNIAKAYPIKGHILTKSQEIVRNDYIAALLSVFAEDGDEKLRTQRKILIYRIIASFDKELNASEYTAKSMKIDAKFWDRFMEEMSFEEKNCFLVDVILLGMYDVSSKREKYKVVSGVLQISGLRQEFIKNVAEIAYAVMKQDFQAFVQLINKNLDYNVFLGYFPKDRFRKIVDNFGKLKSESGKIVAANMIISESEIMNLDEYKAESIVFASCKFQSIRGIRSYHKKVVFENCVFEGNTIKRTNEYLEVYEKNYTLIIGENLNFYKTKFNNCKVTKNLLNISKSKLEECEILNCMGADLPCSNLLELVETDVEKCRFKNCDIKLVKQNNNDDERMIFGNLISIQSGNVKFSNFNDCKLEGATYSRGFRGMEYRISIIKAMKSKVNNNHFEKCRCCTYSENYVVKLQSYMIELHNSSEEINSFINCEVHNYEFRTEKELRNVRKF